MATKKHSCTVTHSYETETLESLLSSTSIPTTVGQLIDVLNNLDDVKPKKTATEYKDWKKRINTIIREYNRLVGEELLTIYK